MPSASANRRSNPPADTSIRQARSTVSWRLTVRTPATCRTCIFRPSGELAVELLNTNATLEKGKPNSVFDADGSAVVVHAQLDDYKTDPTGNAGGRIACGVIE